VYNSVCGFQCHIHARDGEYSETGIEHKIISGGLGMKCTESQSSGSGQPEDEQRVSGPAGTVDAAERGYPDFISRSVPPGTAPTESMVPPLPEVPFTSVNLAPCRMTRDRSVGSAEGLKDAVERAGGRRH
jgi:hypothetical protein